MYRSPPNTPAEHYPSLATRDVRDVLTTVKQFKEHLAKVHKKTSEKQKALNAIKSYFSEESFKTKFDMHGYSI